MNTSNFSILLIAICFLFFNSTCEKDGHDRITIINTSNNNLYVDFDDMMFPDTLIYFPDPYLAGKRFLVAPNSNNDNALFIRDTYADRLIGTKQDTLMVFVFDAKVLESTPWDTVKANYLILKRYDLSYQDLENLNWTITYP